MSAMNPSCGTDSCCCDETSTSAGEPVDTWENERVDGMALADDGVFEMNMAEVKRLRDRHAAYLASLPAEADAIIKEARRILTQDLAGNLKGFDEALYLSFALRPMITNLQTDLPGPERTALLWIADRIRYSLEEAEQNLDLVNDVVANLSRLEREGRKYGNRRTREAGVAASAPCDFTSCNTQ